MTHYAPVQVQGLGIWSLWFRISAFGVWDIGMWGSRVEAASFEA